MIQIKSDLVKHPIIDQYLSWARNRPPISSPSRFYSRLRLVVSRTFNLQNFGHIGCNIIDQLTEPWERIPPVQVTQTVSGQEAGSPWDWGVRLGNRKKVLARTGVFKQHSGLWGTYEAGGGFTSSSSLKTQRPWWGWRWNRIKTIKRSLKKVKHKLNRNMETWTEQKAEDELWWANG